MQLKDCPLGPGQIKSYETSGFLIVKGVLAGGDCDKLIRIAESHADTDFKGILDLETKDNFVVEVIRNQDIVKITESLHGKEMWCIGTQFLFKRPGSAFAEQAWNPHQDNSYIRAPYGTFVSAIIPLVDSDPGNGGMYVYPGSHKKELLPHEKKPSFDPKSNPGNCIPREYLFKYRRWPLYMKKGSLYIQHGNLIHGSYPNKSQNRPRPHFGIMYVVKGVPYTLGNTRKDTKPIELR